MTIKELEERTGLERTTIRFYEKEGFLTPTRLENGYRDFSENDLNLLLRIKLLRSLLIPVEEIRGLQNGTLHLNATLSKQMERLEEEIGNLTYAKDLCKILQKEQVTFETLDATKYLDTLPEVEPTILSSFQASDYKVSSKQLFEEIHPFRRYFARMLDLFIYETFVSIVVAILVPATSVFTSILLFVLPLVCMLWIEPWLLHHFHTTIGKFVFGLTVTHTDDSPLTYTEGFERTKKILFWGLGFDIPLIRLFALGFSFYRCINAKEQPWSVFDTKLVVKNDSKNRYLLLIIVVVVCFLIHSLLAVFQMLPPNRGELTQEELMENMAYYTDLEKHHSAQLPEPTYTYSIENDVVTGVSFEINATKIEGRLYPNYSDAKSTALAFGCAQGTMLEAIQFYLDVDNAFSKNSFDSIYLKTDSIKMRCYTQTNGYELGFLQYYIGEPSAKKYYLVLDTNTSNSSEPYYRFRFSIKNQ